MALGARTFNFFKFLSLYSHNMKGHPMMVDVAHGWWKTMDEEEKHWYFYNDEEKYIAFIDKAMVSEKCNLIIAPAEREEDGIMLWWTNPSQKFHVPFPNKAFRKKLLEWMS